MKKLLLSVLLYASVGLSGSALAQAKFVEGTSYTVLPEQLPLFKLGEEEVVEYFWYGCPHCFTLSHAVGKWVKESKPEGVGFYDLPSPGGTWNFAAQAKYTAEKLGIFDDFHNKYFEEIHKKRNKGVLFDRKKFDAFITTNFTVSQEDLDKAWDSFEVKKNIKQALNKAQMAAVNGVPAFVVNGKYLVTMSLAGSEETLFEIIEFLLATTDVPQ